MPVMQRFCPNEIMSLSYFYELGLAIAILRSHEVFVFALTTAPLHHHCPVLPTLSPISRKISSRQVGLHSERFPTLMIYPPVGFLGAGLYFAKTHTYRHRE